MPDKSVTDSQERKNFVFIFPLVLARPLFSVCLLPKLGSVFTRIENNGLEKSKQTRQQTRARPFQKSGEKEANEPAITILATYSCARQSFTQPPLYLVCLDSLVESEALQEKDFTYLWDYISNQDQWI